MFTTPYSPSASSARTDVDAICGAALLRCPRCQGDVLRVQRRLRDRLLSALWPVHRYRCLKATCTWEYNLRQEGLPADAGPTDRRVWRVLDSSRLGPLP